MSDMSAELVMLVITCPSGLWKVFTDISSILITNRQLQITGEYPLFSEYFLKMGIFPRYVRECSLGIFLVLKTSFIKQ